MQPIQTAHMRPPATCLTSKTRRVSTSAYGQLIRFENLIAIEIRDWYLRRRNQIQSLVGVDIHLPFLIGQLPRRSGTRFVDHDRRQNLFVARLTRLFQKEIDQCAYHPRHLTHIEREARASHFYPTRKIDAGFKPRNVIMRHCIRKLCIGIAPCCGNLIFVLTFTHWSRWIR